MMYPWHCPRDGCRKYILAYSESGMRALAEEHLAQHAREDREENLRKTAITLYRPLKDYNTLNVTARDIGFLKTRGVSLDDKIELDLSIEPRPSTNFLSRRLWTEILEAAWTR